MNRAWHTFESPKCSARFCIVEGAEGGYLLTEARGTLPSELGAQMIVEGEKFIRRGSPIGAYHLWYDAMPDSGFREEWMSCLRKWGSEHFLDSHFFTTNMAMSMAIRAVALIRRGRFFVHRTRDALIEASVQRLDRDYYGTVADSPS
ncbi:MAG: hypothetical protein AAF735_03260 [Myxococcota bacterium]